MEEVDRVANRVTVGTLAGLMMGGSMATLRGYPVFQSAMNVAGSCALIGTACFSFERISGVAIRMAISNIVRDDDNNDDRKDANNSPMVLLSMRHQTLLSHAIGGCLGGAMVGGLYHHRIVPGMLVFTPGMFVMGMLENHFQDMRAAKLREVQKG